MDLATEFCELYISIDQFACVKGMFRTPRRLRRLVDVPGVVLESFELTHELSEAGAMTAPFVGHIPLFEPVGDNQ